MDQPLMDSERPKNTNNGFLLLLSAIGFEVCGTFCMRLVEKNGWWRLPAFALYFMSFSLFPSITAYIPLSVAYVTWSGIGSVAVAIFSVACFGDPLRWVHGLAIGGVIACTSALYIL